MHELQHKVAHLSRTTFFSLEDFTVKNMWSTRFDTLILIYKIISTATSVLSSKKKDLVF